MNQLNLWKSIWKRLCLLIIPAIMCNIFAYFDKIQRQFAKLFLDI